MENVNFQQVITEFKNADIDEKIKIYISAEGLSQDQYKQLLKEFPMSELNRLEEALR